jgi:hypothetical protein
MPGPASGAPVVPAAAAAGTENAEDKSLLDGGGDPEASAAAAAGKTAEEIAAEKEAQAAEEKRILEADPATLNDTEKATQVTLKAAAEEKRLLETPKEQLSTDDQAKQAVLLKAKEDAKKAAAAKGAPETYADFKVPDGFEIKDASILESFKGWAKKNDLSQEAAQEAIDMQIKHVQSIADGLLTTFNETVSGWKKETVAALGADYKKELVHANKAIVKFGSPELRKILNQTGIGNHKELVNFFVKVGKTISEDVLLDGTNRTGQKSDGELFYGDTMK